MNCDPLWSDRCPPEATEETSNHHQSGNSAAPHGSGGANLDAESTPMTPVGLVSTLESVNAQIVYLIVPAIALAVVSLQLFKYSSIKEASYALFESSVMSTNLWKVANLTASYSTLGLYGIVFITQLISIFGVIPFANVTVWLYAIGRGKPIVDFSVLTILIIAYDQAGKSSDAGGSPLMNEIVDDLILFVTFNATLYSLLLLNGKSWLQTQWDAMPMAKKIAPAAQQDSNSSNFSL